MNVFMGLGTGTLVGEAGAGEGCLGTVAKKQKLKSDTTGQVD